jgi:hypothetical protein
MLDIDRVAVNREEQIVECLKAMEADVPSDIA